MSRHAFRTAALAALASVTVAVLTASCGAPSASSQAAGAAPANAGNLPHAVNGRYLGRAAAGPDRPGPPVAGRIRRRARRLLAAPLR